MFVGGCDIGSTTGKVVVLSEEPIRYQFIVPSATRPEDTARIAMQEALGLVRLCSVEDSGCVVGTGYGRMKVPSADENISEITCHRRGAHWLNPNVRTVVDIGGQDCKVMSVDAGGKIVEFVMNDRCAAGTGRLFEAMARVLDCGLEGISALENQGSNPASIANQCTVLAESEVVTLINEGVEIPDLIAGINLSVAFRSAHQAILAFIVSYYSAREQEDP